MKTKNLILLASLFLIGSQIVTAQSKAGGLPVFDFSKDYPLKKVILQDMADVEYVPLETTDNILLGGSSLLSAVTDKYILVHESRLGDIFVFDRNTGKLYSHFNHKGQGGMEYNWINIGTILDEKKEEIYVCSQSVQVYSLKGEYKRTLKISTSGKEMGIFDFDDESLLIYEGVIIEPGRENKTPKDPYRLMSKKDGSLVSVLGLHFPKRYSNKVAQHLDGNIWRPYVLSYPQNMHDGSDLIIADISSDTIYRLSPEKGLIPLLTRKPSVHVSEPRHIWMPFVITDKFIQIGKFLLDFNARLGKIPEFMYDFKTGDISRISILDAEFSVKPYGLGEWYIRTFPAIAKNMTAQLIQAPAMIEAYQKKRLKGNGNKVAKELIEDDNPVVRIITFK